MPTFLEELDKIKASDPMGGLLMSAQADLIKNQTMATENILQNFTTRLQQMESQPLTVEEQLEALNKDPDVQKSFGDLTDQIADYQSLTYSIYERQVQMNKIYSESLGALGAVGGDIAERVVPLLQDQQKTKDAELTRLAKLPFESLQYKTTLLDIENAKFDIEKKMMDLQTVREDKATMGLFADIINTPEFTSMMLERNTKTGNRKYKLNDFFNQMFLRYGNDPKFNKAWLAVDEYIRKYTEGYSPDVPKTTSGKDTLAERDLNGKILHNWLKEQTIFFNNVMQDGRYMPDRQAYFDAANEVFGSYQEKEQKDPNFKFKTDAEKYMFGANQQAIDVMEDGRAKQLAQRIYDLRWNPDSEIYYKKYLNQFKNLLGYNELIGDRVGKQGEIVDLVTGQKYPISGHIMTFDGGYINLPNPAIGNLGDPNSLVSPGHIIKEMYLNTEATRKSNRTNSPLKVKEGSEALIYLR